MKKMIKIFFISISIVLFLLITDGLVRLFFDLPSIHTYSWQAVCVDGVGTFKVPGKWNIEWEEKVLYITDKPRKEEGYALHMVGVTRNPHMLFEGMEKGKSVQSGRLSSGAGYSLNEYNLNGKREELFLFYVDITETVNPKSFQLLVLNRNLSKNTLLEITKTFKMEN